MDGAIFFERTKGLLVYDNADYLLLLLHVCRRCGTGDDFDQFSRDDGLAGSVVEDLEPADHVACVLRCVLAEKILSARVVFVVVGEDKKERGGTYIHRVTTGRLLAGMSLGQSPVQRIGQGILPQIDEDLVVNLEGGKVL